MILLIWNVPNTTGRNAAPPRLQVLIAPPLSNSSPHMWEEELERGGRMQYVRRRVPFPMRKSRVVLFSLSHSTFYRLSETLHIVVIYLTITSIQPPQRANTQIPTPSLISVIGLVCYGFTPSSVYGSYLYILFPCSSPDCVYSEIPLLVFVLALLR